MLLLLISFLAGVLTILAPCVLPVLPVIIGGSVGSSAKHRSRPYVIAAALAMSIIGFTLLLKVSTLLVGLPPSALMIFSGGLVILLGCAYVIPELWEWLVIALNWQATSQRFLGESEHNKDKYIGPIVVGIALGPVFASCSPTYAFILASVLPRSFGAGLFYLIAYSLGLVATLLAVSLAGRKLIRRFPWAVDTRSWFRRAIGLLFILIGLVIISGNQTNVELWVANHLPFDETKIEQMLLSSDQPSIAKPIASGPHAIDSSVLNVSPTPAPEFAGLTNWINSPALQLSKLKGKVVLVDFWTYSCINCLRTLPYIEKWYSTYQKDGFVVVGVNTPEFAFEHNPDNVAAAAKKDGIKYPVALDNDYDTWNAYQNNSWPADYLIDAQGNIRYTAIGEGDYDKTEEAIQALLGINQKLKTPTSTVPITGSQTPETYLGTSRGSSFSGSAANSPNSDGSYAYTPVSVGKIPENGWTLSGDWVASAESITTAKAGATLSFKVNAKDVYIVAGSIDNKARAVTVTLPSDVAGQFGADAPNGTVQISGSRLYHIVSLKKFGSTTVTLTLPAGVSLYTFTFGS